MRHQPFIKKLSYSGYGILFAMLVYMPSSSAGENAISTLLKAYLAEGISSFNARKGQALWQQVHLNMKTGQKRSCTDCHGKDIKQAGKYQRSGIKIEPMAPSVNPKRLQDVKKIEKWLKHNCEWTFGRDCTLQEKANLLTFLQGQ